MAADTPTPKPTPAPTKAPAPTPAHAPMTVPAIVQLATTQHLLSVDQFTPESI
jgi:hypothetical protein